MDSNRFKVWKIQKEKEMLNRLPKRVNWEIYEDRAQLLLKLGPLFDEWIGPLPNLREIFQGDATDRLLTDAVCLEDSKIGQRFVSFVALTGYKDQPRLDEGGNPILQRTTAIHHASRRKSEDQRSLLQELFKIFGYDANYSDFFGCSHFHVACQMDCPKIVAEFLDRGQHPDCLPRSKWIETPLHLIIQRGLQPCRLFELLLRRGADPNLADNEGRTPLHAICEKPFEAHRWAARLFEFCGEQRKPLNFDARDRLGRTPLHVALAWDRRHLVEILMRDTDPNSADAEGLTPLHTICKKPTPNPDLYVSWLFENSERRGQRVLIDAQDNRGWTPLQWALWNGTKSLAESLLRRGADPNLADAKGSTPLHYICESKGDSEDLAIKFFEINDKRQQTVQIEAKNDAGSTPLESAVARVLPGLVDVLLKRGADLSSFVFPSKIRFGNGKKSLDAKYKLRLATGLVAIVERLEKGGYELERSDALTIMDAFSEHQVFEKSTSLVQSCRESEEFVIEAKNIEVIPGASLYDLISLRPSETARQLTCTDYFKNSEKLFNLLSSNLRDALMAHLAEKLSRRFFLSWALDPFCELIHLKLPVLCCQMIIENLANEDLYTICLAATGQN